jgi:uncharacterized OB-fold protein
MSEKTRRPFEQFFPMILQTVLGIIILLIIWLIISRLPMLEEIDFPLDFTLSELVGAGILTVIIAMLVSFAIRIELRMSYVFSQFPQGGTIVKNIVFLIAILIAYWAYKPLLDPYMGDLRWVYSLVFLFLFIMVLIILARNIYHNVEGISSIFTGTKSSVVICNKCGNNNSGSSKFCSSCGAELPQITEFTCKSCGEALKPGARFCPSCGAAAGEPKKEGQAAVVKDKASLQEKTTDSKKCVSCGAVLKEGAKFCSSCGDKQK